MQTRLFFSLSRKGEGKLPFFLPLLSRERAGVRGAVTGKNSRPRTPTRNLLAKTRGYGSHNSKRPPPQLLSLPSATRPWRPRCSCNAAIRRAKKSPRPVLPLR